jgi:hypothetical protein
LHDSAELMKEYFGKKSRYDDVPGLCKVATLAGNLAIRFPWQRIEWDGENMQATNLPEANAFVQWKDFYRAGWPL